MSTCRSCGASIRWALTTNDKRIPVEASPGGNMLVCEEKSFLPKGTTLRAVVVAAGTGDHVSHFATCPQSKEWRKP